MLENGHKLDKLLSQCGILDAMVEGHDLKPSNLIISCAEDNTNIKVTLHMAAYEYNRLTTAVSTSCKCKS